MLFHDVSMQRKNVFKEVTKIFVPNRDVILFSFDINLSIISPLWWTEFNNLVVPYV